jgi:hypothetical protein
MSFKTFYKRTKTKIKLCICPTGDRGLSNADRHLSEEYFERNVKH